MNTSIRLIFSVLLALTFNYNRALASHAAGSHISYEKVNGSNQYLFTVALYRDCGGVTAPVARLWFLLITAQGFRLVNR